MKRKNARQTEMLLRPSRQNKDSYLQRASHCSFGHRTIGLHSDGLLSLVLAACTWIEVVLNLLRINAEVVGSETSLWLLTLHFIASGARPGL